MSGVVKSCHRLDPKTRRLNRNTEKAENENMLGLRGFRVSHGGDNFRGDCRQLAAHQWQRRRGLPTVAYRRLRFDVAAVRRTQGVFQALAGADSRSWIPHELGSFGMGSEEDGVVP